MSSCWGSARYRVMAARVAITAGSRASPRRSWRGCRAGASDRLGDKAHSLPLRSLRRMPPRGGGRLAQPLGRLHLRSGKRARMPAQFGVVGGELPIAGRRRLFSGRYPRGRRQDSCGRRTASSVPCSGRDPHPCLWPEHAAPCPRCVAAPGAMVSERVRCARGLGVVVLTVLLTGIVRSAPARLSRALRHVVGACAAGWLVWLRKLLDRARRAGNGASVLISPQMSG